MAEKTADDIMKMIKDQNVEYVDIRFCDLPGVVQHFSIPAAAFDESVFEDGLAFDGSSVRGFQSIHESDMMLLPDPATAQIDPFRHAKTLNLNFYPVDNDWRIMGEYEAYPETRTRSVTNVRDIKYDQQTPGIITFKRNGKKYSLESNTSGESMSVIFMDGTTGQETFSGGRFLLLDKPDDQGKIILDFNKALSFPCAYNAFTTCPVPPEKNRLPLIVSAGEKAYNK